MAVRACWLKTVFFSISVCLLTSGCGEKPKRDAGLVYQGICDGSAAVRLGSDKLMVAYDEMNSLFVFDAAGGSIQQTVELGKILPLPDNSEMDLEAAVAHGNGVWWIGSHGLDSKADSVPNRRVLFKTGLPGEAIASNEGAGTGVTKTERVLPAIDLQEGPYDLGELLSEFVGDNAARLAPKNGGLNVEGMSVTPDGDLLVALRSPLTDGLRGDATILQLARQGQGFQLVKTRQLSLGDRGIRDIAISDNGYYLIAGAVESGGDFSVYRWQLSGELREVFSIPPGFNAEGLVDMGQYWLVLSDDGKVKRKDQEASDGDRICDRIVRKNSGGHANRNVYFRGIRFTDTL